MPAISLTRTEFETLGNVIRGARIAGDVMVSSDLLNQDEKCRGMRTNACLENIAAKLRTVKAKQAKSRKVKAK